MLSLVEIWKIVSEKPCESFCTYGISLSTSDQANNSGQLIIYWKASVVITWRLTKAIRETSVTRQHLEVGIQVAENRRIFQPPVTQGWVHMM